MVNPWKSCSLIILSVNEYKLNEVFDILDRKPNCNSPGSACYDPRFIGGDGIVFYFHGKSNQQFSLVSDRNLQINDRFSGHRPADRTRDYTWIQALGMLFSSHSFSVEATKVGTWDNQIDHLKFTYNGNDVVLEEAYPSTWYSPEKDVKVERISSRNSVIVSLKHVAQSMINVVPVTKEDDWIHNYQVPSEDCFAHLEFQFKFFALSPKVEGVLSKAWMAMPVVGGEDEYQTSSLLWADCVSCMFSPQKCVAEKEGSSAVVDCVTLYCTRRSSLGGYGIVCKK